jgi:formylglycine-generating enzyme required for sulfatase activity/tRNA A-37 threonylcarbamoyl transferase component Bud32
MGSFLEPGTVFGRDFKVVRELRAGGMGTVYLADQLSTGKPRALKVMSPGLAADPVIRERFILEARASSKIDSEHVVEVVTAGVDEQTDAPFLVMELLRGEDLGDALHRLGPLPLGDAVEILAQMGHALEQAHAQGIVHRDLKPENVFVAASRRKDGGFTIKLLDFGVAKLMEAGNTGTQPLGTPLFMAPEQTERAARIGPATDVWALGLLAFRILTGKDFWLAGNDSLPALMREVCVGEIPFASARARALGVPAGVLPAGFDAWFARCVDRDVAARFPEAGEAVRAFADLAPPDAPCGVLVAAGQSSPSGPRGVGSGAGQRTPASSPQATPGGGRASDAAAENAATMTAPSAVPLKRPAPIWLAAPILGVVALGAAWLIHRPRGEAPPAARAPTATPASASARPAAAPPASTAPSASAKAGTACPAGMILIPGGKMFMGARDLGPDAKPTHPVTVSTFCLDRTEVTAKAYRACTQTGECERALDHVSWPGLTDEKVRDRYSPFCNANHPDRDDHPINCVDWAMADRYCKRHGFRLPTEAEWEFAARGPTQHKYPWGDEPPSPARLNGCGRECSAWGESHAEKHKRLYDGDDRYPATAPVGSFPAGASAHGVLDLAGNVQEWTADWYAPYTADAAVDPKGPPAGTERVVRGNDFFAFSRDSARPASRFKADPETYNHAIGFRCAADST